MEQQEQTQEIKIDGSQGEGGGQILRTSLSLSMITGRPLHVVNIRAGRSKPGLLRQHLACVKAAQEITGAEVVGASLRSEEITFVPGAIRAGQYTFSVGTAGSTTLIFQTILPALLMANAESEVYFEGGTHNGMAPSFDFIAHSFLPALKKMGIEIEAKLERYGFFPSGGGRWYARIPALQNIKPLSLTNRGELEKTLAVATSAKLPEHITERELERCGKKMGWSQECLQQNLVQSVGPGNIVSLRLAFAGVQECFEVVGEKSTSAERVTGLALKDMNRYLNSKACVGEHLADQLLLPMILASIACGKGGEFTTIEPSLHTTTNIDVIRQILGRNIRCEEESANTWRILV